MTNKIDLLASEILNTLNGRQAPLMLKNGCTGMSVSRFCDKIDEARKAVYDLLEQFFMQNIEFDSILRTIDNDNYSAIKTIKDEIMYTFDFHALIVRIDEENDLPRITSVLYDFLIIAEENKTAKHHFIIAKEEKLKKRQEENKKRDDKNREDLEKVRIEYGQFESDIKKDEPHLEHFKRKDFDINKINIATSTSKPFNRYYNEINGVNIEIDFKNRKLVILNYKKEVASTIYFSKKVKHNFTFNELINKNQKEEKLYYVFENADRNLNWLWFELNVTPSPEVLAQALFIENAAKMQEALDMHELYKRNRLAAKALATKKAEDKFLGDSKTGKKID